MASISPVGPGSRAFAQGLSALLEARHARPARAAALASPVRHPITPRAYSCQCGRPVFFRNSTCLVCHTPLGYDPQRGLLLPLEPTGKPGLWREFGCSRRSPSWRRCGNLDGAAGCNWLVADTDANAVSLPLCRCCRLTRTLPDLSITGHALWWSRIELAKRQLVSSLIGLKLPVLSKAEDPQRGLVFDLLRAPPGGPPVITGHADGVITIDVEEADDATREQRREALGEPYRTLVGHLRHETGHYYWQRLVEPEPELLQRWRQVFGDERQDYVAALQKHYVQGPVADWGQRFVSAYAGSHPWEDWAETWAHYLHISDTLDTARSFGLDGERVELNYERYSSDALTGAADTADPADLTGSDFIGLLNGWMELTGVLNELSRSMGVPDFYPFMLSPITVSKLLFVHRVVIAAGRTPAALQLPRPAIDSAAIAMATAAPPVVAPAVSGSVSQVQVLNPMAKNLIPAMST